MLKIENIEFPEKKKEKENTSRSLRETNIWYYKNKS